ncbi:hypothetical protein JYB64_10185 [Algoriphagus aestuarii]|nr:hypothetical protein [Algoriphagus aestuarii]
MKFIVFCFSFLFLLHNSSQLVFAQRNSPNHSIVTLKNGNEIQGEIVSDFDLEDYTEVQFISSSGEKSIFKPGDILGFKLANGRVFRSEVITEIGEDAFVQVLISGTLELLKWDRKYFVLNETGLRELKVIKTSREVDGKTMTGSSNQYIGILKIAMNDACGAGMEKKIESTKLSDSSLIDLFEAYYACSEQTYQVNVSKVPFSKLSFRIHGGIGLLAIKEYQTNKEVNYFLDKTTLPYFEIGVRFKEFRTSPRLMVDLGIGYLAESNAINADSKLISFDLTGRQEYRSYSVLVPLQVSYVLYKKERNQVYAGTGLTFWFTNFEKGLGELIIDNGEKENSIQNKDFIDRKEKGISPNLKIGYRRNVSDKTSLFLEMKGDYLIKNMFFYPLTYQAIYNYLTGSLTVGVEL